MKTAVVIPVKNEMKGLSDLIYALIKLVSESDDIIFVDAGSTDGTQDLLNKWSLDNPRVQLIVSKGAFPGKGRNIAIQKTDANIIIQIDGGNLPDENWLQEITTPIVNGKADYVTGNIKIVPILKKIVGKKIDLGQIYAASLFRTPRGKNRPPAGGASVAYKKEIWERAGGFPEWLRFGADPIFVKKVLQQNIRTTFEEKAIVYWQIGPSFFHFLKRHALNQKAKIRTFQDLRFSAGTILAHLLLLISIPTTIICNIFWPIPAGILFFMLFRQSAKSMRAYRQRTKERFGHYIFAMILFLFIDFMGILAKIVGTLQGLFFLPKSNEEWSKRVDEYLAS